MLEQQQIAQFTKRCTSNAQLLFVSRAKELISKLSHPSQRLKLLNGRLALRELYRTAEECVYHKTNFINFINVMDELGALSKSDPILIRALPYFQQFNNTVRQTTEKEKERALESLLPFIRRALRDCEIKYRDYMIYDLKESIKKDDLENTNSIVGLFVSDFVGLGASLANIEGAFSAAFEDDDDLDFYGKLEMFIYLISLPPRRFEVNFQLAFNAPNHFSTMQSTVKNLVLKRKVEWSKPNDVPIMFTLAGNNIFYAVVEIASHNPWDAVKEAKITLGQELDHFKISAPLLEFNTLGSVVRDEDNNLYPVSTEDESIGYRKGAIARIEKLYPKVSGILESLSKHNPRDYDRLSSSIRYFRLGFSPNATAEVNFLNLWIGLEYLLRVGGYESDITAMKDLLPKVISIGFFKERLELLFADLWRAGVAIPGVSHPRKTRQKAKVMLQILQDSEQPDVLKNNALSNPLAHQRIMESLAWATNSAEAIKRWDEHVNRLAWHVQRMYRTRNSIVHSGVRDLNLILLTANLREYLETTILLIVDNIGEDNFWSIDQTFRHMKIQYEYLRECVKSSKSAPLPIDQVCRPFSMN